MQQAIQDHLNTICVVWIGFWASFVGVLTSLWSIFRDPSAESMFRGMFLDSKFDYLLAKCIRFSYILPRTIFGKKLVSLRAISWSIVISALAFICALLVAVLTTRDTNNHYYFLADYFKIFSYANMPKPFTNNFANRQFATRLYGQSIAGWIAALLFEYACLTKSRLIFRKISILTKAWMICLIVFGDLFTTVALFIFGYSLIIVMIIALGHYIYPDGRTFSVSDFPSLLRCAKFFSFVLDTMCSTLMDEIRSGFQMFEAFNIVDYIIVVYDNGRQVEIDYPELSVPFSTLLASGMFTTFWTVLISLTLIIVRLTCMLSKTWRSIVITLCRKPNVMWTFAISPSLLLCLCGVIVLVARWVFGYV